LIVKGVHVSKRLREASSAMSSEAFTIANKHAAAGTTITFGKHRGKSFLEVAQSDQGYCKWAMQMESPSGPMQAFVDFLKAVAPKAVATPVRRQGPGVPNLLAGRSSNAAGGDELLDVRGPRLDDNITLVLELFSEEEFRVRPETAPGVGFSAQGKILKKESAYVPPHIFHAISKMKGSVIGDDRRSWIFPLKRHEAVARSLEEVGNVERVPSWVLQMLEKTRRSICMEACPERLPERLMAYQEAGVSFGLSRGGRCLIGDEMGLGKSVQALALMAQYTEEWPVLVICPSSLRWVWKEQVQEWLPDIVDEDEIQVVKKGSDSFLPDVKFWIISYGLVASGAKGQKTKFQLRPDGSPHEAVIADESHNIKEWSAERTKAVVPLLRQAKRAVLLSGTPTRNSPEELHPQLCGLVQGISCKFADFRARYCMQQQKQVYGGRVVSQVVGARNSTELNTLLSSTIMVRRLKKDVLQELPPKRRQKVPLDVADARALKDIQKQSHHSADWFNNDKDDDDKKSLFLRIAQAKLPAVKEYILEVLERGDEKAIVFAHHKMMMDELSDLLEKRLSKDGLTHIRIDGSTPGAKRPELVKKFQTAQDCRIALLSITACGEGLTLTAAGLVIFAELYWVPGAVEQAEARAHRIGTTHNKVVVEFLVVPNSPDEHIYNSLERKKKETSKMLNGLEESLGAEQRERKRKLASIAVAQLDKSLSHGSKRLAALAKSGADAAAAFDSATPISKKLAVSSSTQSADTQTPSPVSRSKLDLLLRAAKG